MDLVAVEMTWESIRHNDCVRKTGLSFQGESGIRFRLQHKPAIAAKPVEIVDKIPAHERLEVL